MRSETLRTLLLGLVLWALVAGAGGPAYLPLGTLIIVGLVLFDLWRQAKARERRERQG